LDSLVAGLDLGTGACVYYGGPVGVIVGDIVDATHGAVIDDLAD
jgi:hypothetical protein